ncbi:MAG: glutamate racemase, partial [Chitinophagales bacterium]
MTIGFLDSGIGGLTVLSEALRAFPHQDYRYYGDSDNAPYGSKSAEEVKALIFRAVDFLVTQGIDALVLACHTATRLVKDELKQKYDFPIIGMETGLNVANGQSDIERKVLFCATDLSTELMRQQYLKAGQLNGCTKVDFLSLQELIVFAEKSELKNEAVSDYLSQRLEDYNWIDYQALVLGCTHFPFFYQVIRQMLPPHVQLADGGKATIQQLITEIPNIIDNSNSEKQKGTGYF